MKIVLSIHDTSIMSDLCPDIDIEIPRSNKFDDETGDKISRKVVCTEITSSPYCFDGEKSRTWRAIWWMNRKTRKQKEKEHAIQKEGVSA